VVITLAEAAERELEVLVLEVQEEELQVLLTLMHRLQAHLLIQAAEEAVLLVLLVLSTQRVMVDQEL